MKGIVKGGLNDGGGASVLTGDALIANVLDGKFFYSDDPDTKLEGTMPNNAGDIVAVSYHADSTNIHIVPAEGYTDGIDDAVVITDANFIASNIANGVVIFEKTGTLGGAVVLTGNAIPSDVLDGKFFYSDDPDTKLEGTLVPLNVSDTTATAPDVALGKAFYLSTGIKTTGTRGVDAYTKALLHMEGANESTTFTDETGRAWTAAGTAKISTVQKAYGLASGLFDGDSDYIFTPASTDFNFGDGDFTIDLWIRLSAVDILQMFFSQYLDSNNYTMMYGESAKVTFYAKLAGTTVAYYSVSTGLVANVWTHLAWVRNSGTFKVYAGGLSKGITVYTELGNSAFPYFDTQIWVGAMNASPISRYVKGYIDEYRVSKGIARWTANFAPGAPYGG